MLAASIEIVAAEADMATRAAAAAELVARKKRIEGTPAMVITQGVARLTSR